MVSLHINSNPNYDTPPIQTSHENKQLKMEMKEKLACERIFRFNLYLKEGWRLGATSRKFYSFGNEEDEIQGETAVIRRSSYVFRDK